MGPTVHLIHGFNVSDGGQQSVLRLRPYFQQLGLVCQGHDYGWTNPITLRSKTQRAIDTIKWYIKEGDILVGHSNGGLICWELAELGLPVSKVICIQPAMRRDTLWPEQVQVLCLYNHKDYVVHLGRVWGRFATQVNPWLDRHGWGAAGYYGFTSKQPNVLNVNTVTDVVADIFSAGGHSTIFREPHARFYWGNFMSEWSMR